MSEKKVQASGGPVLRVSGLDVDIRLPHSVVHAVQDVSLEVSRGEIGHLELGHRKPTLKTLRMLEKALIVRAGWLQEMPAAEHEAHLAEYKERLADATEAEAAEAAAAV